ncbi:MAG: alpha/beta hydrolase [Anaerolineae bacterium]
MIYLLRIVAFLSFFVSSLTLVRPRSGWGRLGLFIPKLFAGTYIVLFSVLGGLAAVGGWLLYQDLLSLGLGLAAMAIGSRHVVRLVTRSRRVAQQIEARRTLQRGATGTMLPQPWVGLWREPPDTPCRRDVAIGRNPETGEEVLVDVWSLPRSVKPSGLGVVFLHGSGWHYADKDFGTRRFFKHLAWQGHVIVDVAYSLAPAVDIFGMMGDVKRAIAWTKQHSDELEVQNDRVVVMGGSAGGHLALLAAYTVGSPRFDPPHLPTNTSVCAAVSYYGPTNLRAQFDQFRELPALTGKRRLERAFMSYLEKRTGLEVIPVHSLLPSLMGGTPMEVPELYELASPSNYASGSCPPTLLLQGGHDFGGAVPQVIALHKSLLKAGAISYLLELPDTEHGFDLYKPAWSPAAQAATYVTERFLASLL